MVASIGQRMVPGGGGCPGADTATGVDGGTVAGSADVGCPGSTSGVVATASGDGGCSVGIAPSGVVTTDAPGEMSAHARSSTAPTTITIGYFCVFTTSDTFLMGLFTTSDTFLMGLFIFPPVDRGKVFVFALG
jgi:hypothetical protein